MNRLSHLRPSSVGITSDSFSPEREIPQDQCYRIFRQFWLQAERSLYSCVKRVEWQANLVDRMAGKKSIKVNAVSGGARLVLRPSGRRETVLSTPSACRGLMPGAIVKGSKARKHQATTITAKDFHLWRFSIPEFLDPGGRHPHVVRILS